MVKTSGTSITFSRGDHVAVPFELDPGAGSRIIMTIHPSGGGDKHGYDITAGMLTIQSEDSMAMAAGAYAYNVVELMADGERVELLSGGNITVTEVIA